MKLVLILSMLFMVTGCGLFGKAKKPVIEKITKVSQGMAIKHLGCESGDAVAEDVEAELSRLLKYRASDDGAKSLWSEVCSSGVSFVLPYLVDLSSKQLPPSWLADGCSLDGIGEDVNKLAQKLCGEIP